MISFLISNYLPDRPSILSDSDNVMWSIFAWASGIFLPGAMSSLVWTVNSVFDISVAWDDKEDHILLARCNTASCSDEAEIQHSLFNADGHISSLLLRPFPERHNRLLWFLISQGTQLIQASRAFIVCYAMKENISFSKHYPNNDIFLDLSIFFIQATPLPLKIPQRRGSWVAEILDPARPRTPADR